MTYDQRSAYRDGSLGRLMKQPGAVNEGTLGAIMRQPGAYADGTLGALMRQPGAYSDGSLGALMKQPGAVNSGVFGDITRPMTGMASLNPFAPSPAQMQQAAAHAAAEAAARAAAQAGARARCVSKCRASKLPKDWPACNSYCSSPRYMMMHGLGEIYQAAAGLGAVRRRPQPWRLFARRSPFSMAAAAAQVRAAVPQARVGTSGLGAIEVPSWAWIAGGVALVATVGYVATRK